MSRSTSERTVAPSPQRRRPGTKPPRTAPASPIARRPAFRPDYNDEPERRSWFDWGAGLSKVERERVKERIALVALSSVLVFAVLLIGGLLGWDKIIVARRTVAVVDGHSFTLRQYADTLSYKQNVLLTELQQVQSYMGGDPSANPVAQLAQQQASQIQAQLSTLPTAHLEELVDDYIIRAEAKKRGITVTPAELDAELRKIVGYQDPNATPEPSPTAGPGTPTAEPATPEPTAAVTAQPTSRANRNQNTFQTQYKNYLRITAGTDAVARDDAEVQVLRRKLNDELSASVPKTQEQTHARHILVPDQTAAQTVLQRLQNGESFEALAAELSTDTSNKDKGGDLGWFPRGVMVSEFEDAAFQLQPGQVSQPVKTQFGYHIIQVLERDPNHELDPSMYESLKNGALSKWLDTEKKNHSIARYLTSDMQEWAMTNGRKPSAPLRNA